jgi:chromosomal replication initiator protein
MSCEPLLRPLTPALSPSDTPAVFNAFGGGGGDKAVCCCGGLAADKIRPGSWNLRTKDSPVSRGSAMRPARVSELSPFLVLPESQLAFAAATQLRTVRSTRPLPVLTICGPSGTGKSHLVAQVFADRRASGDSAKAIEVTAQEFADEWTEAVRGRRVVEMREMYLAHELLICEDLQGFRNAPAAQEALVSLIDETLVGGGRVVLTASAPPQEIRGLSTRLVGRCHGGVSVSIPLPSRASRLKLLKHFAAPLQVPVGMDVLESLAKTEGLSPRELRGQLQRLVQAAQQRRCAVDATLVNDLVAGETPTKECHVADVAREVARQFGVTLRQLRSQSRGAAAMLPRQAAMFLSREVTSAPCSKIGAYFSGRTHSTVVYACERFEQQLAEDARLSALTDAIRCSLARPIRRDRRKPVGEQPGLRRDCG